MDERIATALERVATALEEQNVIQEKEYVAALGQYKRNEETHKDNKEFLPLAMEQSKQSARYFKSSADMHERWEMTEEERTKLREEKKKALANSRTSTALGTQP